MTDLEAGSVCRRLPARGRLCDNESEHGNDRRYRQCSPQRSALPDGRRARYDRFDAAVNA
jgi:hypothetical protein